MVILKFKSCDLSVTFTKVHRHRFLEKYFRTRLNVVSVSSVIKRAKPGSSFHYLNAINRNFERNALIHPEVVSHFTKELLVWQMRVPKSMFTSVPYQGTTSF